MISQDLNSYSETQAEKNQENNRISRNNMELMLSLRNAFDYGDFYYNAFLKKRQIILEEWIQVKKINDLRRENSLIDLKHIHALLDTHAYVNTPLYTWYVHNYQNDPQFIDYAVELPKIKHKIFETEVNWYIENMAKDLEMVTKEHCPSFFKPVLEQDPREARHTSAVINYALEQLEAIAEKITPANAKNYAKDKERYTWCLAGMVPLLQTEEQDPFKENGIHQRWQKARNKIHDCEY